MTHRKKKEIKKTTKNIQNVGSSIVEKWNHKQKKYKKINNLIEKQVYLSIINNKDEYDSTIIHFYEILIQFSSLAILGILFPLSFAIMIFVAYFEID